MHRLLIISIFILLPFLSLSQSPSRMVLEGRIWAEKIYVQNPLANNEEGFCVTGVFINGKEAICNFNATAFEIDFVSNGFKLEDSIRLEIQHKTDCTPRILNFTYGVKRTPFVLDSISVDTSGLLFWKTRKESNKMSFIVEQYRWNKWVPAGTVEGCGRDGICTYTFKTNLHSGENKLRVKKLMGSNGKYYPTKSVSVVSNRNKVKFIVNSKNRVILFDRITRFEIYDTNGSIIDLGEADMILLRDKYTYNTRYYVNYDNSDAEFTFKKEKGNK